MLIWFRIPDPVTIPFLLAQEQRLRRIAEIEAKPLKERSIEEIGCLVFLKHMVLCDAARVEHKYA